MTIDEIVAKLQGVEKTSSGWSARCPAHNDEHASLSIAPGDKGTLLKCHAGCATEAVVSTLGLEMSDLFNEPPRRGRKKRYGPIVASYSYRDDRGRLRYTVHRTADKEFPCERADGKWRKPADSDKVLYEAWRIALNPGRVVLFCEGEKAVNRARAVDLLAVSAMGGALKPWQSQYSETLRGRRVAIIADNDDRGRQHAAMVARNLQNVAAGIKIIKLPGLPPKGDLHDWLEVGGTPAELQRLVAEAPDYVSDTRPTIIDDPGDEKGTLDQCEKALCEIEVYQRGGILIEVAEEPPPPSAIAGPKSPLRIAPVRLPRLQELLATAVDFRHRDDENRTIHPPGWIVRALAARNTWPNIRRLEAIQETPFLLADGSISSQESGYDPRSGIWLDPRGLGRLEIPDRPTRSDIEQARDALLKVVRDFPFAAPTHRAAWLAGVLTPFTRYAYHGPAPLFLFDANVRGCGKSLLAHVTAIIATGREVACTSAPRDDEEFRKRITSILLAGDPLPYLDNVEGVLGCAALNAVLTSTVWTDRVLGASEMTAALPNKSTWYASGNNTVLAADTAWRTVHVRLESPEENPEERGGFEHPDLLVWVSRERPRLVAAVLTLLRGFCAAGRPNQGLPAWGSYEAWSGLVRGAVSWCGLPDPGETRGELASQADLESSALKRLIDGWAEIDEEGRGMTVASVLDVLEQHQRGSKLTLPGGYELVRGAILDLLPAPGNKLPSARSVGMKLNHLRGRVVGGRAFEARTERLGNLWRVVNLCGTKGTSGTMPRPPLSTPVFIPFDELHQGQRATEGNSPAGPVSTANHLTDEENRSVEDFLATGA